MSDISHPPSPAGPRDLARVIDDAAGSFSLANLLGEAERRGLISEDLAGNLFPRGVSIEHLDDPEMFSLLAHRLRKMSRMIDDYQKPAPTLALSSGEPTGVLLIAAERERQVSKEGWTPTHDDSHTHCAAALSHSFRESPSDDVAREIVDFLNDWLSSGDSVTFRFSQHRDGARQQTGENGEQIVWINASSGDPDGSDYEEGETFEDAMIDVIRESGTPKAIAELEAALAAARSPLIERPEATSRFASSQRKDWGLSDNLPRSVASRPQHPKCARRFGDGCSFMMDAGYADAHECVQSPEHPGACVCWCGANPAASSSSGAPSEPKEPDGTYEPCANCGKIWVDHYDGPFCNRDHATERNEPSQFRSALIDAEETERVLERERLRRLVQRGRMYGPK